VVAGCIATIPAVILTRNSQTAATTTVAKTTAATTAAATAATTAAATTAAATTVATTAGIVFSTRKEYADSFYV
jgi:hypothetical protein